MKPYLFLRHCPFKHLYKSFKKWPLTPCSIEWLCAVSYCGELDSAQYDTAQNSKNSNISAKTKPNIKIFQPIPQCTGQTRIIKRRGRKSCLTVLLKRIRKSHLTPYSMILRGTWLRAVSYCAELDSAQHDTARNLKKNRISRRNLNQNQNYFNPLVSGPGRFEWLKNWGVENLVGLSL